MGSRRLPGKVLADIAGRPMLSRVVERTCQAETLDEVWVATSAETVDDPIAALCHALGWACYRGSSVDVLDRVWCAARQAKADVVVRITGDCPLIDPGLIDQAVDAFLGANPPWDLVANRLPEGRDYPIGLDLEVCSMAALTAAWREATAPYHREHVSLSCMRTQTAFEFTVFATNRASATCAGRSTRRRILSWCGRSYQHFHGRDDFNWLEILALFERRPELRPGQCRRDAQDASRRGIGWTMGKQAKQASKGEVLFQDLPWDRLEVEADSLLRELFPVCRSLTGDGVRQTLRRLQQIAAFEMFEIPSGTQCYDWTVPDEWNVRDAYIANLQGERLVDFRHSNLHLASYSIPFEGTLEIDELTGTSIRCRRCRMPSPTARPTTSGTGASA